MSITDVTSRISQLQSQLAGFAPSGSAATSATSFSAALGVANAAAASSTPSLTTGTGGSTGTAVGAPSVSSAARDTTGSGGSTGGGEAVVTDAKRYLGVPYVWGGTDPATGLDCSGLVQRVYRDLGYSLPRVAADQATVGTAVAGLGQARPGDLLAFGSPAHHIGIYVGGGQMIEAPRPGLAVRIGPVYETPSSIRRVVPDTAGAATGTGAVALTAAHSAVSGAPVSGDVPFASLFNAASSRYGVSARLLSAVAKQESGYSPTAVSGAGAKGLMQLMPSTAAGLGVTNPFDPAQSIDGAARMLHGLIATFGRTDLALAAYNAGPGAVRRYDGIPPYRETQDYVRTVMSAAGAA